MSVLLTKEEFKRLHEGLGWEECIFPPDGKEPEQHHLERVAWVGDNMAFEKSGHGYKSRVLGDYGIRYGSRIWLGPSVPTKAQMDGAPWIER